MRRSENLGRQLARFIRRIFAKSADTKGNTDLLLGCPDVRHSSSGIDRKHQDRDNSPGYKSPTRGSPAFSAGARREALSASLREAVVVTGGCALVAVAVNAWIHPEPIPFIATREYEILVPCPEPGGDVSPMEADDPRLSAAATFVVDARPPAEYARWHLPGAGNLPYSYLDPTPPDSLAALARAIARSRSRQVAVYGDGEDPDTGELLGREISGHGIHHVFFVRGGAPALMAPGAPQAEPRKIP